MTSTTAHPDTRRLPPLTDKQVEIVAALLRAALSKDRHRTTGGDGR